MALTVMRLDGSLDNTGSLAFAEDADLSDTVLSISDSFHEHSNVRAYQPKRFWYKGERRNREKNDSRAKEVNLPLRLTNEALRHEDVWGMDVYVQPYFLDPSTSWR
jgi:CRISPR/Cas system CSM-associated protein Csm2 small subunit